MADLVQELRDWLWEYRELIGLSSGLIAVAAFLFGLIRLLTALTRRLSRSVQSQASAAYSGLLELFVGREVEIAAFHSIINDRSPVRPYIVNVHGRPGIGKSWLAAKLIQSCRDKRIDWAKVDFSEPAATGNSLADILSRLAGQLGNDRFDRFSAEFLALQELSDAGRLLPSAAAAARVSPALERVATAFWRDVEGFAYSTRVCLFFDSYEAVQSTELERLIIDVWLAHCPPRLTRHLTFVFLGWNALAWPPELDTRTLRLNLTPLSRAELRTRLQKSVPHVTGQSLDDLASFLEEQTEGWPLSVGVACSILRELPQDDITPARLRDLGAMPGPFHDELRLQLLTDHLLERLPADEIRLLRHIAAPRWFSLGQLLATVSLPETNAQRTFSAAVERFASILKPRDEEGFKVEEPIRTYIIQSWHRDDPDGLRSAQLRLLDYYTSSAATLTGDASLEARVEALYHAAQCNRLGAIDRSGMTDLFRDVFFAGERAALVGIMEAALRELVSLNADQNFTAWCEVFAARLLYWTGRWDDAYAQLRRNISQGLSQELLGFANQFLATLAYYRGDIPLARLCVSQAQIHLGQTPVHLARFLTEIGGTILRADGDVTQATEVYANAADLLARHGDLSTAAWASLNLANIHRLTGKWTASMEMFRKALALAEKADNQRLEGRILYTAGRTLMQQGKWIDALAMHDRSLTALNNANAPPLEKAVAQRNRAEVAYQLADFDLARSSFLSSLESLLQLGAKIDQAYLYGNLAHMLQLQGELEAAEAVYLLALELKCESGDRYGKATTELGLAEFYICVGRYGDARSLLLPALAVLRSVRHQYMQARALIGLLATERALGLEDWPARAAAVAILLRRAAADEDFYHDLISDLCLYLSLTTARSGLDGTSPIPRIALRQLTAALVRAGQFNRLLPPWQLLRFWDSMLRVGHVPSQLASQLAAVIKQLDQSGPAIESALQLLAEEPGKPSLVVRKNVLDLFRDNIAPNL